MQEKVYSNPLVIHISEFKKIGKTLEELTNSDVFSSSSRPFSSCKQFFMSDIVIVVDELGNSRVFKNRYGDIPEKENILKITIEGKSGTGKTAIGVLLQNYLTTLGLKNVSLSDQDGFTDQIVNLDRSIKCLESIRNILDGIDIQTKHKTQKIKF